MSLLCILLVSKGFTQTNTGTALATGDELYSKSEKDGMDQQLKDIHLGCLWWVWSMLIPPHSLLFPGHVQMPSAPMIYIRSKIADAEKWVQSACCLASTVH